MTVGLIKILWINAIRDLLGAKFSEEMIDSLSHQTIDSIRRVEIFRTYSRRATNGEKLGLPYFHTSNPYTLAQRLSLSTDTRIWFVYLATYFGKSNLSKWRLFNQATFREDNTLITVEGILKDREEYFDFLKGRNLFQNANYSNHRKYTKKSLEGNKGILFSFDFFLKNLALFRAPVNQNFHKVYLNALKVPNFGRMAAFDFTCNLCKCRLYVDEPVSMYQAHSTGPLSALKDMLFYAGVTSPEKSLAISLGDELLDWFSANSNIYMLAQVLEDSICNWQKSPIRHIRYFG
ncbi:MAG: hypothetical protein H6581_07585 [Bacteroidia bacterium]|nr:hypothetical protein [Bacteroidia bacterium]